MPPAACTSEVNIQVNRIWVTGSNSYPHLVASFPSNWDNPVFSAISPAKLLNLLCPVITLISLPPIIFLRSFNHSSHPYFAEGLLLINSLIILFIACIILIELNIIQYLFRLKILNNRMT
jgi:hypothetical protein